MKKAVWITFFTALILVNALAEAAYYFGGVQIAMFYRLTMVLGITLAATVFAGTALLVGKMSGERPVSDRFSPREVLSCLNQRRTRATDVAVAGLLGIPPQNLERILGAKRPAASWVVAAATQRPAGYSQGEIHPELFQNKQVIQTPEDLRQFIYDCRRTRGAQP